MSKAIPSERLTNLLFHFQPVTSADFPLLLNWLQRPHVKRWWNDGDDTLEKVARHYANQAHSKRFIVYLADLAIGYIQYYLEEDESIGIDLFIGEETLTGRGVGTALMQAFMELLIEWHQPQAFIIDPDPENVRAIRCYEKVGFRHYETVVTDAGKPAYMMRLEYN
jgi:RimJ/RimL family protein N-acetyltransferase